MVQASDRDAFGMTPLFGACPTRKGPVEDPGLVGGITVHIHLAGENLKAPQRDWKVLLMRGRSGTPCHSPTLDEQKKYRSDTSLLLLFTFAKLNAHEVQMDINPNLDRAALLRCLFKVPCYRPLKSPPKCKPRIFRFI